MRWKQFFTKAESVDPEQARSMLQQTPVEQLTVLDVRQPSEYERGHIPGAKLIPLPELDKRLDELDPNQETLVYCAVGGRSRVGAQMLAGRGFDRVFNLKGGFKAWQGIGAYGPQDSGLELFSGQESLKDTLVTAFGLEAGLRSFYLSMQSKVDRSSIQELFARLASIEEKHEQAIFDHYARHVDGSLDRERFESQVVVPAMEGGLSQEEYLNRFQADLGSESEVVDLAMSIEGQALDLYLRAAERSGAEESRDFLRKMADEERQHLNRLGQLLDDRIEASQ